MSQGKQGPSPTGPTSAPARVLIVEDDEHLRLALDDNLRAEGLDVSLAASGAEARLALARVRFDLVLLDIMLPDDDGYAICREIRRRDCEVRVLMLTARTLEDDLVRGFEAGADDYLSKPYRLRELLARVGALLRRHAATPAGRITFAGFALDRTARELRKPDGTSIDLTRTEFDLLACLLEGRGGVLTRRQLLDQVWGRDVAVDAHTVDNFISNLRRKLGWNEASTFRLRAVRGVGYRFELDD